MALSHAILATLLGQTLSGYDLRKQFEGSVGFFWQASFQQIYRELTKLEEQGFLTYETVHQETRPDKKLYRVTEAGRQYLRDWIAEPGEVAPLRDELLVKLFAGYLVSRSTILAELQQHRRQHTERLAVYRQLEQNFFGGSNLSIADKFRYMTLRNGIRYETEWLVWCDEAIETLSTDDRSLPDEESCEMSGS